MAGELSEANREAFIARGFSISFGSRFARVTFHFVKTTRTDGEIGITFGDPMGVNLAKENHNGCFTAISFFIFYRLTKASF